MKAAARRNVERAWDIALENSGAVPAFGDEAGNRLQQALRVRVLRAFKHRRRGRKLDDAPEIHDCHSIGHVAHDREFMGDQQHAETGMTLQILQQIENLRLDRHIERRYRLIEDEERGSYSQSAGEADPLPLATAEAAGQAIGDALRQPDFAQQTRHLLRRCRRRTNSMKEQNFAESRGNALARIERGVRILKDHLDLPA